MKKVLITGAGTGFGHEVAMRLALKGFDVIAAVEVYAQVQTLKREAAARGGFDSHRAVLDPHVLADQPEGIGRDFDRHAGLLGKEIGELLGDGLPSATHLSFGIDQLAVLGPQGRDRLG